MADSAVLVLIRAGAAPSESGGSYKMATNIRHLLVYVWARDDGVYHKSHHQELGEWIQP